MMPPNEKVQHQYITWSVWKCVIPLPGDELDEKFDDTPQHMINNPFFNLVFMSFKGAERWILFPLDSAAYCGLIFNE